MLRSRFKQLLRNILPEAYGLYRDRQNRIRHFHKFIDNMPKRKCPICGYEGKFLHWAGIPIVSESVCPDCLSQSRHRLLYLWLNSKQSADISGKLLHVAPEKQLETAVSDKFRNRITADLDRNDVDIKIDLTQTNFESNSFSVVWASHVLEHIPRDSDALREINRILCPRGVLILLVPIIEAWKKTQEDLNMTSPKQRELYYGLFNHVRMYGSDFRERVQAAGFILDYEYTASIKECVDYSIIFGEKIFIFRKSAYVTGA